MNDISMTQQESSDLALHVDLCAQRYLLLEKRLATVEAKVDAVSESINKGNKSLSTVIISSAATVIASILALLLAITVKF